MSSWMRISVLSGRSGNSVKAWLRLLSGYQPESIQRVGSFFEDIAGGVHSGYLTMATNATQAVSNITFLLVAAGDTVTIGNTVFTGSNSPTGTTQFQTNATPSAAADKVAAASLASVIMLNTTANQLVTSSNTASTPTVNLVVNTPGTMGNFLPVSISAHGSVTSGNVPVNATLGAASSFGVLGDTAVTNTGNTVIHGDLGVSPGSSISGFPPGVYDGSLHQTDTAAAAAHTAATAAAVALQATGPGTDISASDLGGSTRTPGTYSATAAGTWSAGALTLNGAGTYIFLFGTSLTLPANASIILSGGATADNVYFVTGTTFTFGATNTTFGNILAGTAITTATSTVHTGRLLTYGVSGTAVTFPSAATINRPANGTAVSGGSEDADISLYNGIRAGTSTYPTI